MQAQKILAVSSLLTAAMFSASAYAGGDSGFYIGAGLGQASIDETLDGGEGFGSINFDGDDTAYKLIAGYNFGIVPLVDLGVEFEYLDFGEPSEQILGSEAEIDATALALFGIAGVNLGPVGVFGKIGMAGWDGSSSVNGIEVATIGSRFDGLYLPPPSRPDKPLAVKTLIVPTSEYSEGRSVILMTGRSIYTVAMRHLVEQRAEWSWATIQIIEKKARV